MGELNHYQLVAAQQKQRELKESKYKERSKKRLSSIVSTKMKTSFIGAISACESHIGFLWGHGKPDNELSEEEVSMKEIWENVRAQILDNGNSQLRATMNEMNQYTISWTRYHVDLNIEKEDGQNG
tara:strand:+ start:2286 stop:2663 length:378 start_codon:yes stop_codon:yes gene_type:complete